MNEFEQRLERLSLEKKKLFDLLMKERTVVLEAPSAVPPNNRMEQILLGLWRATLAVEDIGIHDNFFELGGDSISAIRLVSKARAAGLSISTNALFQHPTISALAETLRQIGQPLPRDQEHLCRASNIHSHDVESVRSEFQDKVEDVFPLSPMQAGMLFQILTSSTDPYIEQETAGLRGVLDWPVFKKAWELAHQRHPAMRTAFRWMRLTEPLQVIVGGVPAEISYQDLRALNVEHRERQFTNYLMTDRERGFDLRIPPLNRVAVFQFEDDYHRIVWTAHHLVIDVWSLMILIEDVMRAYSVLSAEQSLSVEPARSYRDFVSWQQTRDMSGEERYWRKTLAGFDAATPITINDAYEKHPDEQHDEGQCIRVIGEETTERLIQLARSRGWTLNTIVLGAWALLLSRLSERNDIVTGLVFSGRPTELTGSESMVGLFINTLPLRLSLDPSRSLHAWLTQLQLDVADLGRHEFCPIGQIKSWAGIGPAKSLFDSVFVFQNVLRSPAGKEFGSLIVEHVRSYGASSVPLTIRVTPANPLSIDVLYDTTRFDPLKISALLAGFEGVLTRIAENPNGRLGDFARVPDRRMRASAPSIRAVRPKPVRYSSHELVESTYLFSTTNHPVLIKPRERTLNLPAWAAANGALLSEELNRCGAVLFRGFDIRTPPQFRDFVASISMDLLPYVDRSTPRTELADKIYTSTEYPSDQYIALHNEFSYGLSCPMKIVFNCLVAPDTGGETPIADSSEVFARIDKTIRDEFIRKQVMYVRNYGEGIDLSWQKAFQTDRKSNVEEYCRNARVTFQWKANDVLKTTLIRRAVARHPRTGKDLWFNQAHLFHISNLAPQIRASMCSVFAPADLPRNAYFGDGTPIPDSYIAAVRQAYEESAVAFAWQSSDVLLLDNMRMAHGRAPYTGNRRVIVAMTESFSLGYRERAAAI